MDMSLFQTRKNDSWAKRGVTVATDNLSYSVEQRSAQVRALICVGASSVGRPPLTAMANPDPTHEPNQFKCIHIHIHIHMQNPQPLSLRHLFRRRYPTDPPPVTCKALLKHVTIAVHPGEVAFVMGPSGAGKSTLLDALAGRSSTA